MNNNIDINQDITITIFNTNGLEKQTINTITSTLSTTTLLFLTETWLLAPSRIPTTWTQHHTYGKKVDNSYRGSMGTSLLIHPDCPYPVTILPNSSPYILSCQVAGYLIHCLYLPPPGHGTLSDVEAIEIMSQLPLTTNHNQNGTIICGDINARNKQLLGDKKDTNRGLYLNNFMIENGFQCLNSTYAYGEPTFIKQDNTGRLYTSIIDLFLCNEPLD